MNYAIIVAGGSGSRMGGSVPKQFLLLEDLPVMMHALLAFHHSKSDPHLIVVLLPDMRGVWAELCDTHVFDVPHTIVDGGKSRFESVKNGLAFIQSTAPDLSHVLIAVHDAARPLITPALIDKSYEEAARTGAAALAMQSTNSVRIKSSNGLKNNAHPRQHVYLMQTPQTFNGHILASAYEQPEDTRYTDDAAVVERKGHPISLVDGDARNIKITFPEDLQFAAALLRSLRLSSASNDPQEDGNDCYHQ